MFYRLTLFGKSRETRKKLESAWLDKLIPIGSGTDLRQLRIVKRTPLIQLPRPVGLWHSH